MSGLADAMTIKQCSANGWTLPNLARRDADAPLFLLPSPLLCLSPCIPLLLTTVGPGLSGSVPCDVPPADAACDADSQAGLPSSAKSVQLVSESTPFCR